MMMSKSKSDEQTVMLYSFCVSSR